jgi:hypothetical protein
MLAFIGCTLGAYALPVSVPCTKAATKAYIKANHGSSSAVCSKYQKKEHRKHAKALRK